MNLPYLSARLIGSMHLGIGTACRANIISELEALPMHDDLSVSIGISDVGRRRRRFRIAVQDADIALYDSKCAAEHMDRLPAVLTAGSRLAAHLPDHPLRETAAQRQVKDNVDNIRCLWRRGQARGQCCRGWTVRGLPAFCLGMTGTPPRPRRKVVHAVSGRELGDASISVRSGIILHELHSGSPTQTLPPSGVRHLPHVNMRCCPSGHGQQSAGLFRASTSAFPNPTRPPRRQPRSPAMSSPWLSPMRPSLRARPEVQREVLGNPRNSGPPSYRDVIREAQSRYACRPVLAKSAYASGLSPVTHRVRKRPGPGCHDIVDLSWTDA
jgi:hypothetical protein